MQIDVEANLTLEVDNSTFQEYLELADNDYDEALYALVTDQLDGEEISTFEGRAWICGVDQYSVISE